QLGKRACSDASGGFARGCSFEKIARLVKNEIFRTGKGGQAGGGGRSKGGGGPPPLPIFSREAGVPTSFMSSFCMRQRTRARSVCHGGRRQGNRRDPFQSSAGPHGHSRAGGDAIPGQQIRHPRERRRAGPKSRQSEPGRAIPRRLQIGACSASP